MSTGGHDDLNSEINVTPMVDIMLVLLIIFMITAPMLQGGVELELPKATTKPLAADDTRLTLQIDKAQRVYLGATQLSWATLGAKLASNELIKQEKELFIDADANIPYGVIVTAMAVAKQAGVERIMMVTQEAGDLTKTLTQLDQGRPTP